ncbi:tRNA pseudouridine(55) synthase TruB [Telmatobacter bradus]|uniref:tRNA pseudouridine(55) synthase TruB n=1 Tax=Telmatobacter bradus TaxID=474953 RepID=UPI003B432817
MNGLLVIDKPAGMTSHDVVSRLRKICGERSIGHLGTLDPMATGVLPLLMGKYTRLAQYFSTAEKSYTGAIRFGFATDTYDAEGQPSGPDLPPAELTLEQIRAKAVRFHGVMDQMPPPYSAKKIAGTPAYKLAREGKPVELKTAKVDISSFEIESLQGVEASFAMSISAGGYVRSVAHELGQEMGCGAHLTALRRTRAGVFSLEDTHTLAELDPLAGNTDALEQYCVHPRLLLSEMPSVTGDAYVLGRLRNGAQANLPEFSEVPMVKVFSSQRELAAIVRRVAGTLFQPVVVLDVGK